MHFGVSATQWKGDKGLIGLITYGAEDVASESPENRRFRLPHCRLTPRLQGTADPCGYQHKPYIAIN